MPPAFAAFQAALDSSAGIGRAAKESGEARKRLGDQYRETFVQALATSNMTHVDAMNEIKFLVQRYVQDWLVGNPTKKSSDDGFAVWKGQFESECRGPSRSIEAAITLMLKLGTVKLADAKILKIVDDGSVTLKDAKGLKVADPVGDAIAALAGVRKVHALHEDGRLSFDDKGKAVLRDATDVEAADAAKRVMHALRALYSQQALIDAMTA